MQPIRNTRRRAFTLLEMMLVLVIMGILASVAAISVVGQADNARRNATVSSIKSIETALKSYNLQTGAYPTTEEGLSVLVPNFLEKLPQDGWRRPFAYYSPTAQADFVIISAGKDAAFDTEDDIVSLELE